ncbi:MAG TPA: hypothetical protein VFS43_47290 [Polyangiaceae bacterium]|nr:hypothetical protein [Polyangiaceae bacterium]
MANEPFDLERLRRRWALAASTPTTARAPAPREPAAPPEGGPLAARDVASPRRPAVPKPAPADARPRAAPAPLDPFDRARADLTELRAALATSLGPEARAAVEPFLRRVEQAVARFESAHLTTAAPAAAPAAPSPAPSDPKGAPASAPAAPKGAPASTPADPKALRAELDDALFDLEDLLEVFTIVPQ